MGIPPLQQVPVPLKQIAQPEEDDDDELLEEDDDELLEEEDDDELSQVPTPELDSPIQHGDTTVLHEPVVGLQHCTGPFDPAQTSSE